MLRGREGGPDSERKKAKAKGGRGRARVLSPEGRKEVGSGERRPWPCVRRRGEEEGDK